MRDRPAHLDDDGIAAVVARNWHLEVDSFELALVGGGAHHWSAVAAGRRLFVTVDDLRTKPWLGDDPAHVRQGLTRAYETAVALRELGLAFVVAPLPSERGEPLERIDDRHTVSVFPFVEGTPGSWGAESDRSVRDGLVDVLAELHSIPCPIQGLRSAAVEFAGREALARSLADDAGGWRGGPFSGEAQDVLRRNRSRLVAWEAELDGVARRLDTGRSELVVTHGEPHPGNILQTATGPKLVDWDTVAIGRAERDMWMLVDDPDAIARYRDRTGRTLDPDALAAFRRAWALADVAAFTAQLGRPHEDTADARGALDGLLRILEGDEPLPYPRPVTPPAATP